MRLAEIDRGDSFQARMLIGLISAVSRMRLPDAARVAFYHKSFLSGPMGAWTQATMRGPSSWTIAERELMAAMVAKWNACTFCVGAHGAIAAKELKRPLVDRAIDNFRDAPLATGLKATLVFLEKLTLHPMEVTANDAREVLRNGVRADALMDAVAVATLFGIVTRYADALDFAIPTADEFDRAAEMLLKRGYV